MNKAPLLNRVAIIGLGLMGGSLGLAIRNRRAAASVAGFARRPETRRRARSRGVVDRTFGRLESAVRDSDLVVFCTPVGITAQLAGKCISHLPENCVVTDVGSTKGEILGRLDPLFEKSGAFFVGGHPIAGSEKQGLDAARADLYDGAIVALTPTRATDPRALSLVRSFWIRLNARVVVVSPKEHDDFAARSSHLPHLVAAALAGHVGRNARRPARAFCGSGFFDTTRIAEGDPAIWRDIVMSNPSAIARELKSFGQELERVRKIVEAGDRHAIRRFLANARARRGKLRYK